MNLAAIFSVVCPCDEVGIDDPENVPPGTAAVGTIVGT